jgi:hypothetical protein
VTLSHLADPTRYDFNERPTPQGEVVNNPGELF